MPRFPNLINARRLCSSWSRRIGDHVFVGVEVIDLPEQDGGEEVE